MWQLDIEKVQLLYIINRLCSPSITTRKVFFYDGYFKTFYVDYYDDGGKKLS